MVQCSRGCLRGVVPHEGPHDPRGVQRVVEGVLVPVLALTRHQVRHGAARVPKLTKFMHMFMVWSTIKHIRENLDLLCLAFENLNYLE